MSGACGLAVTACLAFLLAAAPAGAASRKPAAAFTNREGQIEFATPSGNIGCIYTPAGGASWHKTEDGGPHLTCDRVKPTYVTVGMGAEGEVTRTDNPGEQACCGAKNVLAYGRTWSAGPFTCDSARVGIDCRRSDGRGFALSRTSVRVD